MLVELLSAVSTGGANGPADRYLDVPCRIPMYSKVEGSVRMLFRWAEEVSLTSDLWRRSVTSVTADNTSSCEIAGGHRPPLQWRLLFFSRRSCSVVFVHVFFEEVIEKCPNDCDDSKLTNLRPRWGDCGPYDVRSQLKFEAQQKPDAKA